jgi:pimeloyl-ACP methyl ester carboxylesterase
MTQIDNVRTEDSLSAGHEPNVNHAPTSKLALSKGRTLRSAAATFLTASAAVAFGLASVPLAGTIDDNAIRPFRVNVPEEALVELRQRVQATATQKTDEISLPVATTVFPEEIYRARETWARRAYLNLIYFHEVDRGGHFAAWEQPALFAAELRAAFRSLREAH